MRTMSDLMRSTYPHVKGGTTGVVYIEKDKERVDVQLFPVPSQSASPKELARTIERLVASLLSTEAHLSPTTARAMSTRSVSNDEVLRRLNEVDQVLSENREY